MLTILQKHDNHLRQARMTIERVNGVLKARFRCLLKHRTLNYSPVKAAKIIYSCGVLHNIAQHFNVNMPVDAVEEEIVVQFPNNDGIPPMIFFYRVLEKETK